MVSDGEYAYVTLNASREECWCSVNELQIIDLQNIERPQLFKQYQMQSPRGLAAQEFTENGGNYIGLVEDEITTNIYKIGGNLIFGLHFLIMDNFYLDSYIGTGIRFSFVI